MTTQPRPFHKVLVANRGEIALRIVRACREAGLASVQVYSEADQDTLAVRLADEAVCIGGPKPADSYLNTGALLDAARGTDADAVHPGYGFLSENADFAEQVEQAGLVYIGPQPAAIRTMGDKIAARQCAEAAGVPVIPGSAAAVGSVDEALTMAHQVGYPVLIKASAGGGGRGMRVARDDRELAESMERAVAEAEASFGCGEVYIEKFLERVRHIEVQIVGDGRQVIHLGERDCSLQRRHQKLVEEAPAAILSPAMQERIRAAATRLAETIGYRSAGTVEFVVDVAADAFYFIEMNTRIQVEHPVTELLTGIDLVKLQLSIAAGRPLGLRQQDVNLRGHAIELRINAEDPDKGFLPRSGRIDEFAMPAGPGIRVDTHVYPGYALPAHYDSLLGKLLVWGQDRDEALARMRRALHEARIEGVATTLSFHRRLLDEPAFRDNDVHTRFIKEQMYCKHPMQRLL
ncbi:acetyl-CoA carboxylase biotin carboxylase subunit [Bordetella petrii]|nr:acetyl-CoA carboxylase biotin carboxylase subunit [Bordetella petrii]